MNEQELTDAMRASLPPRPDARGWADAARSKARNRRVGVVGAALVAAVAIAVPFAVQYNREVPPVVLASPTPTPPLATTQLVPDACVDPDVGAVPLVDDDLPEGATRMWLCGRQVPGSTLELVGHPDPLVERVDEAVAAFNAMETGQGVMDCMPIPLDYTVVVEYPDATHRAARIAGCGDLRDITNMFDVFRGDGAGYLATLQELWAEERAEVEYAFTGAEGLCDANLASVNRPLDVVGLSRIIACAELPDGTRKPVNLPEALVAELLESARTDAQPWEQTDVADADIALPDLVLLTPHGDPLSVVAQSIQLSPAEDMLSDVWVWYDSTQFMVWSAPQDLRGAVSDLVAAELVGHETVVPDPTAELPSGRGDWLEPLACTDIATGEARVPDLDASDRLPDGAARAWLCGGSQGMDPSGIVGPAEPLTLNVDRAVAAVNNLPPSQSQECTADGGISYVLVFDYPDGTSRPVSGEAFGCGWVGGFMQREGGKALLPELLDLWQRQREALPEPFVDEVPLCQPHPADRGATGINSMLPVRRAELYRGVVCGLSADSTLTEPVWIERELPGDLVIALTQAGIAAADDFTGGPNLPFVVMLNQFGDPVTYPVGEDRSILLADDNWNYVGKWLPEGDLANQWEAALEGMQTEPS